MVRSGARGEAFCRSLKAVLTEAVLSMILPSYNSSRPGPVLRIILWIVSAALRDRNFAPNRASNRKSALQMKVKNHCLKGSFL